MPHEHALLMLIEASSGSPQQIRAALALARQLGKTPEKLCGLDPAELAGLARDATHPGVRLYAACGSMISAAAQTLRGRLDTIGVHTITLAEASPRAGSLPCKTLSPVLTLSGNATLLNGPMLGVVGARNASLRGLDVARACGSWAATQGIAVVSGSAAGIDTAAQESTLRAGGTVVAVLPQGILTYDPPEYLRCACDAGRAVLVSMFHPDLPWRTFAATTRNDLIAALSMAVCVIEPLKTGGSLRTGNTARDMARPVLVYPVGTLQGKIRAEQLRARGATRLRQGVTLSDALDTLWQKALVNQPVYGQQPLC